MNKINFSSSVLDEGETFSMLSRPNAALINREVGVPNENKIDHLISDVRFKFFSPVRLPSESRDLDAVVAQVGFRLVVPEGLLIKWCRLKVGLKGSSNLRVVECHPRRIAEANACMKGVVIHDDDLFRVTAALDSDFAVIFNPDIIGFAMPEMAIWDFFPQADLNELCYGQLMLYLRGVSNVAVKINAVLFTTLVYLTGEEIHLETPVEVRFL